MHYDVCASCFKMQIIYSSFEIKYLLFMEPACPKWLMQSEENCFFLLEYHMDGSIVSYRWCKM